MAKYEKGEDVEVSIYGDPTRKATVEDKTRGDATVVKYEDGSTELVANKAIRKAK
jgi:hypothetical protein